MKKMIFALSCGLLFGAVCLLGACGETAEERFEAATRAFDNYTANVEMEYIAYYDGSQYTYNFGTVLKVDGAKGYLTSTLDNTTTTYSLKEENGSVSVYTTANSGWRTSSYRTIEEAAAGITNHCHLEIFQKIYFDETEEEGDIYRLKDSALASYSTIFGSTLTSAKIKLDGSHFTAAEVVGSGSAGSTRFHLTYTFSGYGSTSVTLPA